MLQTTPRQLEIFAQMVAAGDVDACARDMALPPETILRELASLEERLGYQLFDWAQGGADLTPAGRSAVSALEKLAVSPAESWIAEERKPPEPTRDFVPDASAEAEDGELLLIPQSSSAPAAAMGPEAAEATAEVTAETTIVPPHNFRPLPNLKGQAPDSAIRNIVLAAHPAIFSHFQEALSAFEASNPDVGITLRLEPLTESEAGALLDAGLTDIAWFYGNGPMEGRESRYAWSERISLFIGEAHPLAREDAVMADDLADVPYLALGSGNPVRRLTEQALAGAGLHCPDAAIENDNLYDLMRQVQHGRGWFAAFGPMARDFGKMRAIARLPYAQGLPQVEVRQAVRAEMEDDPAIAALAEYLFR